MLSTLVFSLLAVAAKAQESSLTASIAPAATTVPSDSDAGVPLFETETVQLTEPVVAELQEDEQVAEYAYLFAFENSTLNARSTRAQRARRAARCKTYPGDLLWPSKLVWGIFDLVLGGALSPIIPLASPCYPESEYNNYDAQKCAAITNAWGIEKTQ